MTQFTINLRTLFDTTNHTKRLTLYKPPVVRGNYRMMFNKPAFDALEIHKLDEVVVHEATGESVEFNKNTRIAMAKHDENHVILHLTSNPVFFTTKTVPIAKNGVISSKKFHKLLSETYGLKWEEDNPYEMFEIATVDDAPGLLILNLITEDTDDVTDVEFEEAETYLAEVEEVIEEAEAANVEQPMMAEQA